MLMDFLFNLSEPKNVAEECVGARIGLAICVVMLAAACFFAFNAHMKHGEYFSHLFIYSAVSLMIPATIFASVLRKLRRIHP